MAKVTVRLPTPLRQFAEGKTEVEVDSTTVGGAMLALSERLPGLRRHLLTADGTIRNFVAVYVNDRDVRTLQKDRTELSEGDVVAIVPAIAGGSSPRPGAPRTAGSPVSLRASRPFSPEQLRRYSRHLLLPEVGVGGQRALRDASVLVVGAGGLGSPAALYLAAAGIGRLGLVDVDAVEMSNLQRQILYGTRSVGRSKLLAAEERLNDLNPDVDIVRHELRLEAGNALDLLRGYDVVLDGTDNFPTRYLVNDACVLLGKPNVYGSIYRFEGQVSVFDARHGPCYRCLYPEPPPPDLVPSCAEAGVFGVLPGVVGSLQATETIKLLTGVGEPLYGRLLLYDAASMRFRELTLSKDPACVLCSPTATQKELIDYAEFCGVPARQAREAGVPEISPEQLAEALKAEEPPLLVDVREPEELEISHIDGALLIPKGELPERVDELTRARSVVVFCRSGQRSAEAVRTLLDLGFDQVRNLKGGINAWVETVDPSQPVY